jgi:protein MAK16
LQSGTYGDIYNFPVKEYEKVLAMEEMEAKGEESEDEEEEEVSYENRLLGSERELFWGEQEYNYVPLTLFVVNRQEEEPEVEYVEGYEMDEEDDDAMEDFAQGASRMADSEDGKILTSCFTWTVLC